MRIIWSTVLVSAAIASAAMAQTPSPSYPPEQIAARANDIVTTANAADFFVHEPHGRAILLRHVRSGMLCRFAFVERGGIEVVASESLGIGRGDDVSCTEDTTLGAFNISATRRPEGANLDEAFSGAVGAIRAQYTRVRAVDLSRLQASADDLIPIAPVESRTAAFRGRLNGETIFTRVSVFVADGWEYKMRFTTTEERHNILGEVLWRAMVNDVARYTPPAATGLGN
ncbi:MAG: hypothetical protein NT015_12105 [Alphaproteobacteria bacterium]|nr:hypothetical protein [Alphaproteobacteria bacterium]